MKTDKYIPATICVICVLFCWGCEEEKQPPKAPAIVNLTVTDITESSAKCTFTIEPVGAAQKAGVIFGTDPELLSGTGEASTTTVDDGVISLTLNSLFDDTLYYYKAYLSDKFNSIIYSDIRQFRTSPLLFNASETSINVLYQAGSYKFNITSNGSWTIASNQEWCTIQPTSGSGDREITVSVTENTSETVRSATLTITRGNRAQQVMVEQEALLLNVSNNLITATPLQGSYQFTVSSNAAWAITSNQGWCTVQPASGNGDREITVSVAANTTGEPRTATLTVTAGNQSRQVTVEQDKDDATLDVSITTINAPYSAGQHTFNITSNAAWTIASDQDWCTVQPPSGTGNREITISVTENAATIKREAILTVTAGNVNKQVTVSQEAKALAVFENGIVASANFEGGNGTPGLPYQINSAVQLKKLVDDVNNGNGFTNTYFILTTDIKVTADEWIPIGIGNSINNIFRGNFDGNGHTISGTLKSDKYNNFGFFGSIFGDNQVSNLNIAANVINEGSFNSSNAYTGAIVGSGNNVVISNCNITGHLTGGIVTGAGNNNCYTGGIAGYGIDATIQNCVVSSNVTGGYGVVNSYTGGIIGSNTGSSNISTCSTSGIITGSGEITSYTGGIAGESSSISDCTSQAIVKGGETANASYTGGISGNSFSISNCTTSYPGTITGGGGVSSNTGGITGISISIANCTNNMTVSAIGRTGGITGYNNGSIHTSLNTGNINGRNGLTGGLVGENNGHLYSCCTNRGGVNGQEANYNNQIGTGEYPEECKDGHTKR